MKRHINFLPAAAVLLVLLLSACGGSSGGGSSPPPPPPPPAGEEPTGTRVGSEGGTVVSGDGQLTLTIPEGALANETDIVITELTGDDIPSELQDSTLRKVYDLQPDGLEFALPATVEVRSMGSPAPPDGAPIIGLVSESGGVLELLGPLENTVDNTGIVASAPISHFSSLAIYESDGLTLALSAGPSEVPVGGSFTLTLEIWTDGSVSLAGTVTGDVESGLGLVVGDAELGDLEPPGFSLAPGGEAQHSTHTATGTCTAAGEIRLLGTSFGEDPLDDFFIIQGAVVAGSGWTKTTQQVIIDCVEPPPPPPVVEPGLHPAPAGLTSLEYLILLPYAQALDQAYADLKATGLSGIFSGAEGYAITDLTTGEVLRSRTGTGPFFGAVPISQDPPGPDSAAAVFAFGPGEFNTFLDNYNPETGEFNNFVQLLPSEVTDAFPAGGMLTSGEIPYVQADGVHFIAFDETDGAYRDSGEIITDDTLGESGGTLVSAYAQTAGGPLLVVTREPGEGRLFFTPHSPGGANVIPEVGPVGADARRIRCELPVCGVTSFEEDLVTIVLWDGVNTPTIADGPASVGDGPVGLDLMTLESGNVLIGSTGFNDNTVWLTQVATDGGILSNDGVPVDEDCESPGHIAFFEDDDGLKAAVTCFTSSNFEVLEPVFPQ